MSAGSQIDYDALAAQHGGTAASGNVDYDALAAQHGGMAAQQQPKGVKEQLADFGKSLWQQINPVSGLKGMAQAVAHPVNTVNQDVQARQAVLDKAHEELSKGNYADGAAYWLYAHTPLIGAQLAHAGQQFQQGNYGAGAGESTGIGLNLAGPKALAEAKVLPNIKAAAQPLAEKIYQSTLKPSTTLSGAQRSAITATGLQAGIPISEGGLTKLRSLIDDLNSKVSAQIQSGAPKPLQPAANVKGLLPAAPEEISIPASDPNRIASVEAPYSPSSVIQRPAKLGGPFPTTDAGVTIDPKEVVKRLDNLKTKFSEQSLPDEDIAAIESAKQQFIKNHPDAIPAQTAQNIKVGTYQQLRGKYGELGAARIESEKALARGIKEELENQFPEIKGLNAQESKFINLDQPLEKAVSRIANRNLLSLTGRIASGAAGTMIGSATGDAAAAGGSALATMVLHEVVTNPAVQSRLAIALSKYGKVPRSIALKRISNLANGLSQSGNAMGLGNQASQQ